MKRVVYFILGLLFLAIAWAGVFIPGLPTTVFLLISLWMFLRSSSRMYKKVKSIKAFEKTLKHIDIYEKNKAVTKKVKIISQSFAWTSVLIIISTAGLASIASITGIVFALSCSLFMNSTKTHEED